MLHATYTIPAATAVDGPASADNADDDSTGDDVRKQRSQQKREGEKRANRECHNVNGHNVITRGLLEVMTILGGFGQFKIAPPPPLNSPPAHVIYVAGTHYDRDGIVFASCVLADAAMPLKIKHSHQIQKSGFGHTQKHECVRS